MRTFWREGNPGPSGYLITDSSGFVEGKVSVAGTPGTRTGRKGNFFALSADPGSFQHG